MNPLKATGSYELRQLISKIVPSSLCRCDYHLHLVHCSVAADSIKAGSLTFHFIKKQVATILIPFDNVLNF